MGRRRLERVTELLHQEISKLVMRLQDPGIGLVTILGVRLSQDFTQARVFYSIFGTADEKERSQKVLNQCAAFFRGQLGKLESLKFPPEIGFVLDTTGEDAQHVLGVLSDLEKERESLPQQQP
jgi:ribosome-binding factor A